MSQSPECSESEGDDLIDILPEYSGYLSKWTNYISGWQERWVVLCDGHISYYRSEMELDVCRGSYNLKHAEVSIHEYDDTRIDITQDENYVYFQATSPEEAQTWYELIESTQNLMAGERSDTSIIPWSSSSSLASIASGSSQKYRTLHEKFNEMEMYKKLVSQQSSNFQNNFLEHPQVINILGEDIKKETLTFKATMNAMVEHLKRCTDLMRTYEEESRLKVAKERENRKKIEHEVHKLRLQLQTTETRRRMSSINPDMEEGPHMMLTEGEFFDALEDSIEVQDRYEKNLSIERQSRVAATQNQQEKGNRYAQEVEKNLDKICSICKSDVTGPGWEEIDVTDTYQLYRRDVEADAEDKINDALIAFAEIKGVSAKEICKYFYNLDVRKDWEAILETYQVLEDLGDNTLILNQTYKRIWPAGQRDVTILSHLKINEENMSACVINFTVEHEKDVLPPGFVRAHCNVGMHCTTIIADSAKNKPEDELTRDDISVQMIYTGDVSPGGWVPKSVVRATSKREYPKFVQRIGKFCYDHLTTHNAAIEV